MKPPLSPNSPVTSRSSCSASPLRRLSARLSQHCCHRLKPGQIIIDIGTSDPVETKKLAQLLERRGIFFADAPMTGGPEQAANAAVGSLVGADAELFARIEPIIACYSSRARRFGPPGSGQTAKLVSNYVITGMIALVAEAFGTARQAGIDWADLYEVMQSGSGNSGVLKKMMEAALAGDFDGYRWSLANANKDISYYADLAESLEQLTPLTEAVRSVFAEACDRPWRSQCQSSARPRRR